MESGELLELGLQDRALKKKVSKRSFPEIWRGSPSAEKEATRIAEENLQNSHKVKNTLCSHQPERCNS